MGEERRQETISARHDRSGCDLERTFTYELDSTGKSLCLTTQSTTGHGKQADLRAA